MSLVQRFLKYSSVKRRDIREIQESYTITIARIT